MKKFVRNALFLLMVFTASSAFSSPQLNPSDVEVVYDWKEYKTIDGIKIEYKFKSCDDSNVRNQVLVLFRYTNTSAETKTMTWITKEFRDGNCYNCQNLDNPEYARSITLTPDEVLEGDGSSLTDNRLFLFSNFINLVPGMSGTRLTNFEFIDTNVSLITE